MSNPVKCVEYIKYYTRVAPNLLKVTAFLSDINVRKSAIDREDLKRYWKSEKRLSFTSFLFTRLY